MCEPLARSRAADRSLKGQRTNGIPEPQEVGAAASVLGGGVLVRDGEGGDGVLPRVLTIAGSDSGGGAGVQADLKTFLALGAFGMSALTAVTAQNTLAVAGVEALSPDFVALQIRSVADDIGVDAAKTGMLFSAAIIEAVAETLRHYAFPLVVDPVMVSKSGARLLREDAVEVLKKRLLPLATVVTPNLPEAHILAGLPAGTPDDELARAIQGSGVPFVLLKGGHRPGPTVTDRLYGPGLRRAYPHPRHDTPNTHGTGCTLSAAIAVGLARGLDVAAAVELAIRFVDGAIRSALPFGHGHGPLHHGWYLTPFSRGDQD